MAPTGTGQRGVLGPGAAFLTKTWAAAPQRLRAPAPGERRGTGPGASYLRLRPACALPAPGRVPGAWCGPRGRRLGGQRRPRAAGWAWTRTAHLHLRVPARRAGPTVFTGGGGAGRARRPGDGEQGRADWRELAATGCCPSGLEERLA